MKEPQKVAVIGAGLVGSLLALVLSQRGHSVDLYEKRSLPRNTLVSSRRSTHLVISARGWKALDIINARSLIEPLSIPLKGRRIHAADHSRIFQPYSPQGDCIYAIQRNTLNGILTSLCKKSPNITLHCNQRCMDVNPSTGDLMFENTNSGAHLRIKADWIFASDGANSSVRAQLLKRERIDYTQKYEQIGYKELLIPATYARQLERDAMHAWPRKNCSLFAFPNTDGSFTATLLAPFNGIEGFSSLDSEDVAKEIFRRKFTDLEPKILAQDLIKNPISSLASIQCSPWTFEGRLALVGDAAHSMVPFLGQGMNAGFEDCSVINDLLIESHDDFATVLGSYEAMRKPHCDAITTLSAQALIELTEYIGNPKFHLIKKLEDKLHSLYPEKYKSPYDLIAFTHIPYADAQKKINEIGFLSRQLLSIGDIENEINQPHIEAKIRGFIENIPHQEHFRDLT